ncbi:uridine diphosphate glucose pyrophosphatase NUDT14 isoform X3 [Latimeria chalumnae]|uniref:uridine diphosphate glucose pyrophosphatase NUDT14 isoform X3 n=1 Tax=Latimeria chalumnae TaxID=7897 RepID=UPI00313E028F
MELIDDIRIVPCRDSKYLKTFRLHYQQNGIKKSWDFMRTHDSVSVLIFNTTRQSFVMVKQFRPAVYMCEMEKHNSRDQDNDKDGKPSICNPVDLPPASVGITYELCAGIVDKPDLSLEEIAKQEILEECGYDVPVANLKKITSYRCLFLHERVF